jgi:hypothetical protein
VGAQDHAPRLRSKLACEFSIHGARHEEQEAAKDRACDAEQDLYKSVLISLLGREQAAASEHGAPGQRDQHGGRARMCSPALHIDHHSAAKRLSAPNEVSATKPRAASSATPSFGDTRVLPKTTTASRPSSTLIPSSFEAV